MRLILLALLALPTLALDNSVTVTDTASASGLRPVLISRVFKKGEIANYPRPYVDGVGATTWQSEVKTRWSDGSVQHALVAITYNFDADESIVVDFRNSANPCSSGNQAACEAASLDEAGILAFNSGSWGAQQVFHFADASTGFDKAADARTMVDAADFEYWMRGPVVTVVVARDQTSSRTYDVGASCSANCTAPYSTAQWADDATEKPIHPEFVLSFWTGISAVKVDYLWSIYWFTHLRDQRYTLTLKSDSSASTTEYSYTFTHYARQYFRKTFWDGTAPSGIHIDFNREYLIYSGMFPNVLPMASQVDSGSIAADVAFQDARKDGDFPLSCSYTVSSEKYCGSWLTNDIGTGGAKNYKALFPQWITKWLLSQDEGLYQVVLQNGDAFGAFPHHYRESDAARYFDEADSVGAFGKMLSHYGRGGVYLFKTANVNQVTGDKLVPLTPMKTVWGSGDSFYDRYTDDATELSHRGDYAFIPYLLTGDWYYLQLLIGDAGHILLWNRTTGYSAGTRRPALPVNADQFRGLVWGLRGLAHAMFCIPDDWDEKAIVREGFEANAAAMEGRYGLTVAQSDYGAPCSTSPFSLDTETSAWCWALNMNQFGDGHAGSNPLKIPWMGGGSELEYLNTPPVYYGIRQYQTAGYWGMLLGHLYQLFEGEEVAALRQAEADFLAGMVLDTKNPFVADDYNQPAKIRKTATLTASLTSAADDLDISVDEIPDGLADALPAVVYLDGAADEWVKVCSIESLTINVCAGGRGWWGDTRRSFSSSDTLRFEKNPQTWAEYCTGIVTGCVDTAWGAGTEDSWAGYGESFLAGLAGAIDLKRTTNSTQSVRRAWEVVTQNAPITAASASLKWLYWPTAAITNVRVSGTTLRFTAPDGAACSWAADAASTLDSGETALSAGIRERTVDLSSLEAGQHTIRLTCGTARTAVSVTVD